MKLDIRLPIGLMFLIIGGLLAGYGLTVGAAAAGSDPDPRVDLWWGLLMLAFGAVMLLLSRRRRRATAS